MKAYLWSRAMGAEGIREAADLSVLANNYMDKRILEIPGITRSNAQLDVPRMEMTRFSLGELQRETGIGILDVANRLADYGIDGPWESHEPWIVPEPITPEAGEMWSKEDLDYWIDALAQVCREAREDPELVRTAPHNQVVHKLADVPLDDPDYWATTWRAYGGSTPRWQNRRDRSYRSRHRGVEGDRSRGRGRARTRGRARGRALRLRPGRRGGGDRGDPGRPEAARRRRPLRPGRGDACLGDRQPRGGPSTCS